MKYTLQPDKCVDGAADGTFCLTYLLNTEDTALINEITPAILTNRFGERTDVYIDPEKGYTDPEWYWEDKNASASLPSGHKVIWGIGFRWGEVRLRGNSEDAEAAKGFIKFLKNEIEATSTEN